MHFHAQAGFALYWLKVRLSKMPYKTKFQVGLYDSSSLSLRVSQGRLNSYFLMVTGVNQKIVCVLRSLAIKTPEKNLKIVEIKKIFTCHYFLDILIYM